MPLVLDASVVACWAFDDEDHPDAAAALRLLDGDKGHVPALWWFEIRNTLLVAERRGRITASAIDAFLHELGRLVIEIDRAPDNVRLLGLCRRHRLTVYDGAYLELALRRALPIATIDKALAAAAQNEAVAVIQA